MKSVTELKFITASPSEEFLRALQEYQGIWDKYGDLIILAYERIGGYNFPDNEIEVEIFEGISQSHPMKLRASNSYDAKKGDLVHELGHRYNVGGPIRKLGEEYGDRILASHKALDLILFDVLVDLFGERFAQEQVARERNHSSMYGQAWDWALAMTADERQAFYKSMRIDGD